MKMKPGNFFYPYNNDTYQFSLRSDKQIWIYRHKGNSLSLHWVYFLSQKVPLNQLNLSLKWDKEQTLDLDQHVDNLFNLTSEVACLSFKVHKLFIIQNGKGMSFPQEISIFRHEFMNASMCLISSVYRCLCPSLAYILQGYT